MSFMMRCKKLVYFLFLFFFFEGLAQKPEEILEQWSSKSPIEKVYLHIDRENYFAGETAWFKAYLYSDFIPDTISTTLYVELSNDSSQLISRKILPVLLGNTHGQFELPDTLHTGHYYIRAYTPTLYSRDPGFICRQSIFVFGKKKNNEAAALKKPGELRLEFFPEGGHLISGLNNTIAFKATNEYGLPVPVSGVIKNDNGETLTSFSTYHDGMGMFDLTPIAAQKYYALIREDPSVHKYFLPAQENRGIVFKIISGEGKKFFELLQLAADTVFRAAYMIGQMQHHVVFRQEFSPGKDNITGTIDVSHLGSGILQVTVFSKDHIPLSERLTFVNNGEYIQQAELIADTIDFSPKKKNSFHVALKDTVFGFFSVAVTDPANDLYPSRQNNLVSSLLLTADLKGYIHNPAYYFSAVSDSAEHALDLVMMINGWRRFRWSQLVSDTRPAIDDKDPGFISIDGHLKIRGTKKYFAGKPFVLFIYSPDSSRIIRMSSTGLNGYFHIDSLLFFDRSRLQFKDTRGKKSEHLQVDLSTDSLAKRFPFTGSDQWHFNENIFIDESREKMLADEYDAFLKAEGLLLEGVTIKTRTRNSLQELEERYASGHFSGMSERTYDLVHTGDIITYENILEYLSYKIPGISISRDGPDYYIYYRQVASLSSMGLIPMTLYLDEIETDASFVSSIPAREVAMVKVYSSFVGSVGNGAGGVLAIYSKKGSDLYNEEAMMDMVSYQGYSVIREFYAPDYSVDTAAISKPDRRITLLWEPQVIVNGMNGKIPITFYNNDRSRQFKVVVEGMTVDGKMLMIEKTFDGR